MSITRNPAVGEVLQCDFGDDYKRAPTGEPVRAGLTTNGRMPPEMVKKRLVVVLNGKMTGGCLVVPLSKTEGKSTTTTKYHVPIAGSLIVGHDYFEENTDRWALGEQIQQVSKDRLNPFHPDPKMSLTLPSELVTQIQKAVIKAINAGSLLPKDEAVTAQALAPAQVAAKAPSTSLSAAFASAQAKQADHTTAPTIENAIVQVVTNRQAGNQDAS
ncbi:uncharacterized protein YifN (PemK superfamily) [Herbaspirillum sp. Sphag1AN]|uniref:type II toxin-antitoxin system PemK/MazF family toxin n=1 Tax=unclassified Herbaspirillum TaxID=2624150 RepID=UPI001608F970|nr:MULTISPECIES: type II toxin-antitoxin system PemK/MazF family toxin [unclassified Herbaspirillum]MBB3214716.1 uncharacterized protein YifN (PemK superfamily) [Herbaspirillum sp. Sphag1AN]MBB3247881.1 uncharacterized protein YifN (PemK superfamily) [Herbaspirillum sp. Sphag64]